MAASPVTLYLHGDVSAHLDAGAVEIEGRRVTFDAIDAMIVFSPARVTTPLILALADAGISVAWITRNGVLRARTACAVNGGAERLLVQVRSAEDPAICLQVAKSFVVGRLRSMAGSLARGARDGRSPKVLSAAAKALEEIAREAVLCGNLESLRLVEAIGAGAYWSVFGELLVNPAFTWSARSRRPPADAPNALISFLSVLWTSRCEGALAAHGLDPRIGFLHSLRPGRASLACDLVEEFRAWGPEREALTLLNLGQLRPPHFHASDGGVFLGHEGREIVLAAHHRRLGESVRVGGRKGSVQIRALPAVQAERLAKCLIFGERYLPWAI